MPKICSVETCNKKTNQNDKYCPMHRARLHRTGSLEERKQLNPYQRLMVDMVLEDDCWVTNKYITKSGYGRMNCYGKKVLNHRISWVHNFGEIPEGLFVLHKCDNRRCFNPSHLFLGTKQDNTDDAIKKGRFCPSKWFKRYWDARKKVVVL